MEGSSSLLDVPEALPQRLGKYELIRRLATGGMAELYLARATGLHGFEKLVVLKRILPHLATNDEFTQMFLTEARLAANLEHPNVAQVYDIGEQGGAFFFTMEYVRGRDLRETLRALERRDEALPIEHIVHVGTGAAAGLHHAHEAKAADGRPLGIVHRDVSPSNILVTYEGDIKLVDFGIAKAAEGSGTTKGSLKGKIPYMSPEQCRGQAVDRRSDIFSLGAVLWELVVGERLFKGESELELIHRIAQCQVTSPSSIGIECPRDLEWIIMRALAADPRDRHPTAHELRQSLEQFAHKQRLAVSSVAVADFMTELFPPEQRAVGEVTSPGRGRGRSGSDRHSTRFSGSLEDMSVVELVQTAQMGSKTGTLDVQGPFGPVRIWCEQGQVIDATLADLPAREAFFTTLLGESGEFEFKLCDVHRPVAIETGTQHLVLEGMRRLDEWRRDTEGLPPLETHVRLRAGMLPACIDDLPAAECEVLSRLGPAMTLGKLALQLNGEWGERGRTLARWYAMDLLEDVTPDCETSILGAVPKTRETIVTSSPEPRRSGSGWLFAGLGITVVGAVVAWSVLGLKEQPPTPPAAQRPAPIAEPGEPAEPAQPAEPAPAKTQVEVPGTAAPPTTPAAEPPRDASPSRSKATAKERRRSSKRSKATEAPKAPKQEKPETPAATPPPETKKDKEAPWEKTERPGSVKNPFD